MKITNNFNMPKSVVHAVTHDRYDPGSGDVSCTTLIAPAQIFQLSKETMGDLKTRDGDDIFLHDLTTEDATERIWTLMGSAVHYVLENAILDMKAKNEWAEDYISERRFYHTIGGKRVSAQIDLLEGDELSDFKLTSVWTIKHAIAEFGGKPEWTAQLNIQRYLMYHNGIEVKKLWIMAFARDWNRSGARQSGDYPPRAVKISIPLWSIQKTEEYILSRINALYSPLPVLCTPDECWESLTMYALKKKGRKSALRVFDNEKDIGEWAVDKGHADIALEDPKSVNGIKLKTGFSVEVRIGERRRCQDYCEVMPFCQQYANWKEENGKL